jgi:hypothetical protein
MRRAKKLVAVLSVVGVLGLIAPAAHADAPGPGDKQCRGATGNNNPHCPPPPSPGG